MEPKKKATIQPPADDEIKRVIGNHIKTIRKSKLTLSAETVARELHMSRSSLTQMENGKTSISAVTIWKLACIYGVTIESLFPRIPDGFSLSKTDIKNIANEDEQAVGWAKELFGGKNKNE